MDTDSVMNEGAVYVDDGLVVILGVGGGGGVGIARWRKRVSHASVLTPQRPSVPPSVRPPFE